MNRPIRRQVLECARPLALSTTRYVPKRPRAGALPDAGAATEAQIVSRPHGA